MTAGCSIAEFRGGAIAATAISRRLANVPGARLYMAPEGAEPSAPLPGPRWTEVAPRRECTATGHPTIARTTVAHIPALAARLLDRAGWLLCTTTRPRRLATLDDEQAETDRALTGLGPGTNR